MTLVLVLLKSKMMASMVSGFCLGLAQTAVTIAGLFDTSVGRDGTVIFSSQIKYSIDVTPSCSALIYSVCLVSAVLVFCGNNKRSFIWAIQAFASIQMINILRIISLMYAIMQGKHLFEILHELLWPITFGLVTYFLFRYFLMQWSHKNSLFISQHEL